MRAGQRIELRADTDIEGAYFQTASMASKRVLPTLVSVWVDRAGVPLELAGLHLHAVSRAARPLDGNQAIVSGDDQARPRQRVAPGRLAGLEDQPLDAHELVVERRFRLIAGRLRRGQKRPGR